MALRLRIQQNTEIINDIITNKAPNPKFSPLINPVIIIVITTRQTSIGNSNNKNPQSFLSHSLERKYFNKDTNNKRNTESQKAYRRVAGFFKLSKKTIHFIIMILISI